jgi:hypothetical protein
MIAIAERFLQFQLESIIVAGIPFAARRITSLPVGSLQSSEAEALDGAKMSLNCSIQ